MSKKDQVRQHLCWFSVLLFVILLLSSSGCHKNNPPEEITIAISRTAVESGDSVSVIVSVIDPDEDSLIYAWSSTGGSFNTTSGDSVIWIAPEVDEIDIDTITVKATDEHNATITANVSITVVPQGGVWTIKSPMPTSRCGHAVVEVNGKIYAIGGHASQDTFVYYCSFVEVYDCETDIWCQRALMPTPRAYLGAAVVNDKIYAIGGSDSTGSLSVNEEYDPATDIWTTKAPMPTPRRGFAIAVVEGKIYVVGGRNGSILSINEEYDPVSDSWQVKTPQPTGREWAAAAVLDNRIYVVGGSYFPAFFSTNEEYDPHTDTWVQKAPMLTARDGLVATTFNGNIYAIGGRNFWPTTVISTNEAYDPITDTWTTRSPMPTSRAVFGATVINDVIHTIGGVPGWDFTNVNEMYYAP